MKNEEKLVKNKNNKSKPIILCFWAVVILALVLVFLPDFIDIIGYVLWLLTPFIVAYIVSLIVNPMVNGVQKRFHLPRGICAILVIVLTVGVLGGILTGVIWKIVDEIRNVYEDWPYIYSNIRMTWFKISEVLSNFVSMLPDNWQKTFDDLSSQVLEWIANLATNTEIMRSAGNIAKKLPSIFIVVIVFILSLYFMITDAKKISCVVKKPFSQKFLQNVEKFRIEIKKYVGGYIKAQLIIMCISFTILLIGLSILKIDYALVIALSTAILDALPFFGSGAVLWPWSIISFIMGDVGLGVGLIIIYLAVILMRQLIEPKIVSQSIGVHPLMTLMAMYIGFRIFSIGGMILGPLVMVMMVSLYKTGSFDGLILSVKKLFNRLTNYLKILTNSLKDEEKEDEE